MSSKPPSSTPADGVTRSPFNRRQVYHSIYQREYAVLEEARLLLQDPDLAELDLKTAYRGLADHYAHLLEQAVRITQMGDRIEKRLKDTLQQLESLMEERTNLFHVAVHNLKNPLAAMQSSAELLLMDESLDAATRREVTEGIRSESEEMITLISNLLDLYRAESGLIEVQLQPCDLVSLFQMLHNRLTTYAERKQLTLHLPAEPASALVRGDPKLLVQVLENFLSNAIKYSPPGRAIYLELSQPGPRWRATVRDQGPGISPDQIDRLFIKFARLGSLPTGNESSTGLGLAIAKQLAEAMQGQVGHDAPAEGGAAFWVELPSTQLDEACP